MLDKTRKDKMISNQDKVRVSDGAPIKTAQIGTIKRNFHILFSAPGLLVPNHYFVYREQCCVVLSTLYG